MRSRCGSAGRDWSGRSRSRGLERGREGRVAARVEQVAIPSSRPPTLAGPAIARPESEGIHLYLITICDRATSTTTLIARAACRVGVSPATLNAESLSLLPS